MNKSFGDYLYGAGSWVLGATREVISQHEAESIQAERESGIATTIAILYEANIKDCEIVRLIQKYYGINEHEVRGLIHIEKTIQHPCRELHIYLMEEEGFSYEEAFQYIIGHHVDEILQRERESWKLSPKELLEMVENQT